MEHNEDGDIVQHYELNDVVNVFNVYPQLKHDSLLSVGNKMKSSYIHA